jgi:hypothetical protein
MASCRCEEEALGLAATKVGDTYLVFVTEVGKSGGGGTIAAFLLTFPTYHLPMEIVLKDCEFRALGRCVSMLCCQRQGQGKGKARQQGKGKGKARQGKARQAHPVQVLMWPSLLNIAAQAPWRYAMCRVG